ncbi:hypothetical protein LO80_06970 [Candidatus Francisella endociliophora]|uniref:Uncharacterized protein n=1 Tax=Candidatus Francisella endociliophora TaxID=653937 RepID=A0A097EQ78_9GAMM|nr:pentapeptide repeat-containing protein [Francisella sp. FSC1006]AIT09729.1 hypothetical protein LO80_06970 [Francisella sp. FSC1006]
MSDDKKKKKRPLDDYVANTPTVQEIDHVGKYGEEPYWLHVIQDVDTVNDWFEHPIQLHAVNKPSYAKDWTKAAHNLIHQKVKDLDKDWQEQSIDSIEHDDTDFTDLDARGGAIIANTFKKGTDFSDAKFDKAKIGGGVYEDCKFTNNSFTSAQIGFLEFINCSFSNVNFDKVSFREVIFRNCKFKDCSFVSTQFHTSDIYDSDIVDCVFNKEFWYLSEIHRNTFTNNEFNKSQFSGVLIKDCNFKDNSFLKNTTIQSGVFDCEFSNNQWLKCGFTNNSDYRNVTFYNENIHQCNFARADWVNVEVQNSKFYNNDFESTEFHSSSFADCELVGDNFATAIFSEDSKLVGCDLLQVNVTGATIRGNGVTIYNCILDKFIYAFAMLPKDFDESQLKRTSQAQVKPLTDKDLRKPRDAEDSDKDTSKPLKNLPDKDAAVLCELVYEESFLRSITRQKDKSLADFLYLSKGVIDTDVLPILSDSARLDYENYADYYYPVLDKYKLVAVNPSSSDGYFSIAIANKNDGKNIGIYVITRGSYNMYNYLSDIDMASSFLPGIFHEGISFVKSILASNSNVKYLGFSGHSLGGSVSQAQTVYFEAEQDKKYTISKCKNFEPFGIGNILSNLNNSTSVNTDLMARYKGTPKAYSSLISNFYRVGDLVSEKELDAILGRVNKIETNYTMGESMERGKKFDIPEEPPKWWEDPVIRRNQNDINTQMGATQILIDRMYSLHTMTNYKYQGFNPSLEANSLNIDNVEILIAKGSTSDKENYNFVFQAINGFKEIK